MTTMTRREAKMIVLKEAVRGMEEVEEGDLDSYAESETDDARLQREARILRNELQRRLNRLKGWPQDTDILPETV